MKWLLFVAAVTLSCGIPDVPITEEEIHEMQDQLQLCVDYLTLAMEHVERLSIGLDTCIEVCTP